MARGPALELWDVLPDHSTCHVCSVTVALGDNHYSAIAGSHLITSGCSHDAGSPAAAVSSS